MRTVKIATRGSRLALWQAEFIRHRLLAVHPDLSVEMMIVKTKGDVILDVPLAKVGGKGLFVKEIEESLLAGVADLAVHSMKDVPMQLPSGLVLGAVPKRENPADSLLSARYPTLAELPKGATVGTSSLRRQAQLLALRPDCKVVSLRGNVDTRLRKMLDGQFEAIVMAAAGIKRLNLDAPYTQEFQPETFLPAVGQGALGLECRENDTFMLDLLADLDDQQTHVCVEAERGFLAGLNGGCQVPIAGHAKLEKGTLTLDGLVASIDGKTILRQKRSGSADNARQIGLDLAENLLVAGASTLLSEYISF